MGKPEAVVVAWARGLCEKLKGLRMHGISPHQGTLERLDALLAAGADVNAVGRGCETALHIIAEKLSVMDRSDKSAALVRRIWHNLVARGADALLLDGFGRTALELLSREQVKELLLTKRNHYGMLMYTDVRH